MIILKKMNIKDMNGFKAGVLKGLCAASPDPVFVARMLGSVRAQESVPTTYGVALKFKGTFVGNNAQGEECRSVVCYLPSPVDQMLSDQISEIQGDKASLPAPVEFALDVFAVEDKGETGYKFICKPLLETKLADPVAALSAALPALKLAAPAAAPAIGQDKPETPETPAEEAAPAAKAGKK